MKNVWNYFQIRILISFLIILGWSSLSLLAQEGEILTGVVKAVQWLDEEEVIAAVLVVTSNDEDEEGKLTTYIDEYNILDDPVGKELYELDGETVIVKGTFIEKNDGTVLLKVISYKILDLESEEDSDEEFPEDEDIEEPPK
jgi:hypothetical protein